MSDTPKRELSIASHCAIACREGGFHKFLEERFDQKCGTKERAAEIVTYHCGVESRSELNAVGPEQEIWLKLQAEYKDWLKT